MFNPINIQKSLQTGNLEFKEEKAPDIFGYIIQITISVGLIYASIKIQEKSKTLYPLILIGLSVLFAIYNLYANSVCYKLTTIVTGKGKESNKEIINDFLKKKGYKVVSGNNDIIIANKLQWFTLKTLYFLIIDEKIYFTNQIFSGYGPVIPDLIWRSSVKRKLTKFFQIHP